MQHQVIWVCHSLCDYWLSGRHAVRKGKFLCGPWDCAKQCAYYQKDKCCNTPLAQPQSPTALKSNYELVLEARAIARVMYKMLTEHNETLEMNLPDWLTE